MTSLLDQLQVCEYVSVCVCVCGGVCVIAAVYSATSSTFAPYMRCIFLIPSLEYLILFSLTSLSLFPPPGVGPLHECSSVFGRWAGVGVRPVGVSAMAFVR